VDRNASVQRLPLKALISTFSLRAHVPPCLAIQQFPIAFSKSWYILEQLYGRWASGPLSQNNRLAARLFACSRTGSIRRPGFRAAPAALEADPSQRPRSARQAVSEIFRDF